MKQGFFMVLSVTGLPVLIGDPNVCQIAFLPTNMDAVDADGKPTGEKLHIARTPLINEHRNRINAHLFKEGLTHGSMVLHTDGTAYVVRRETERDSQRVRRSPVMEAGHDFGTGHSIKCGIEFYPGSRILVDPDFATYPATNMTWYESASLSAALEDGHRAHTGQLVQVRALRDPEVTRFITWDDKYTAEEVIAKAHLNRDGITKTASVVGEAAALRTTEEGFVDPFGNVWIWTDGVNARPATVADMDTVARLLRGASWFFNPQDARVGGRLAYNPDFFNSYFGVRWAALLRP
jgi:hypothetical protein